jgi:lysozyme
MNEAGKALVTHYEQIRLKAYFCPAGKPTIGRGHTDGITAQMVADGYTITAEFEQAQFDRDMALWESDVAACLTRVPNENQLAALTAFAFNIGMAGFRGSSALKRYEAGDDPSVVRAMGLWNKITPPGTTTKVVSNGLVARRSAEGVLYMTPVGDQTLTPMPQAVEPPKTQATSTINQAQIIAGGTAAVATVTQVIDQINAIKTSTDSLGSWLLPVLLIVIVLAAGYTLWARHQHAQQGDV